MRMFKPKEHKIAAAVGLFIASLHALWAIVVALGLGQTFMDWIFPLHLIDNLYTVMAFNFWTAVLLIVVTFVAGYVATLLFMCFWKLMKIK